MTQGRERFWYERHLVSDVATLIRRLVAPPDGRALLDLHFGVTRSKLDIAEAEVCRGGDRKLRNDGSLKAPGYTGALEPPADMHWPSAWAKLWPPRWLYLIGEMAKHVDLAELAAIYLQDMPVDSDCNITQFLEVRPGLSTAATRVSCGRIRSSSDPAIGRPRGLQHPDAGAVGSEAVARGLGWWPLLPGERPVLRAAGKAAVSRRALRRPLPQDAAGGLHAGRAGSGAGPGGLWRYVPEKTARGCSGTSRRPRAWPGSSRA